MIGRVATENVMLILVSRRCLAGIGESQFVNIGFCQKVIHRGSHPFIASCPREIRIDERTMSMLSTLECFPSVGVWNFPCVEGRTGDDKILG